MLWDDHVDEYGLSHVYAIQRPLAPRIRWDVDAQGPATGQRQLLHTSSCSARR